MAWPFRKGPDASAAPARHQRGLELLRGNQPALAIVEFEQAVKLDPANPEYLNQLGTARKAAGDLEGAMASYRRALELAPGHNASRYNLGLVLLDLDRPDEAEAHFRRIHESDPRDPDVLFHLALLLAGRSQFAESARLYRSALEVTPDNPHLWLELALVHRQVPGEMEASVQCLRKCLELDPELADAHNVLANILQGEGRLDEAIEHYRNALKFSADNAVVHVNLGNALSRKGRLAEAVGCYREAARLDPALVDAYLNLGSVHGLTGAYDEALRCYDTILRIQPDNAVARACQLFEYQRICDWSRFEELCERVRHDVMSHPEQEMVPFPLLSIPSTPAEQLQCAGNYAQRRMHEVARDRERLSFRHERRPERRLKVGYLSADFREHPAAFLSAELFELHDRGAFQVVAYSYGADDGNPIRARLARAFDQFVDIAPLSHADAAARIHGDGVDILVDLTGYTTNARTEILALRPAPLQVNFLGYPGTLGADFVDYLIADRFVAPPEHAGHFSEKLVRLPGSYQANDRKRSVADTPPRHDLGLPERAFVFCCLNQTYKILPGVFRAWMRLLEAVPSSVLWLHQSNPWAAQNLLRTAAQHGLGPERLIFAPRLPHDQHRARLRAADLFLDTFPYNAHTTTSDALWVGLPVLTCAGDTFASRVAGSLLTAAGMPELITRSLDEYEALALRLARQPDELRALREKLSRNRATAPLFDTPAFARHLEAAYHRMWSNYLAGNPPRAIEI